MYGCDVDDVPDNASDEDRKKIKDFEGRYTDAVNKLMRNPDRVITVRVPGHKPFKVTAGEVAANLIKSQVKALPGEKGEKGAGATNDGRTITLYDGILDQGKRSGEFFKNVQERGIMHEGIHWTGTGPRPGDGARSEAGERSVFDPGALGRGALFNLHQDAYTDAARQLLAP